MKNILHLWIILFFMCMSSVKSILVYKRYRKSDCTDSPFFIYINNQTVHENSDDDYCSNFFNDRMNSNLSPPPDFIQSIGFMFVNDTHVKIRNYAHEDCYFYQFDVFLTIQKVGICDYDHVFQHLESDASYLIINDTTEDIPYSYYLNNRLPNQKNFTRAEIFEDKKCQNHSTNTYNIAYSVNDQFYRHFFPITSIDFNQFIEYSSTKVKKRCNSTHLVQFFTKDSLIDTNSNTAEFWGEIFFSRLDVGQCYEINDPRQTVFGINSYSYHCQESNDFFSQFPSDYSIPFQTQNNYWNRLCYGIAFSIWEKMSGVCDCLSGLCESEYFTPTKNLKFYFDDVPCKTPKNYSLEGSSLVLFKDFEDERQEDIYCLDFKECATDKNDNPISCHGNFDSSTVRFGETSSGDEFYITIGSDDSIEVIKNNAFGGGRKDNDRLERIDYYHSSFCYTLETTSMGYFENSSLTADCIDGILHYTYFKNSISCNEKQEVDKSFPVEVTQGSGDYSFNDKEFIHLQTITCIPLYCNNIAQYDNKICSGHGTCVPDSSSSSAMIGKCRCKDGYKGEFCESKKTSVSTVLAVVSSVAGVSFFFLGIIIFLTMCLCISSIICVFCVILSCLGFLILIISGISVRLLGTVKKFKQLEDFDILLEEQRAAATENEFSDHNSASLSIDQSMFLIKFEEIKLKKILGSGGSGATVYLARWQSKDIAFKVFKTRDLHENSSFEEFEKEVNMISSLSHPNCLAFYGCSLHHPRVGIVMEFCCNGDIKGFINLKCFSEEDIEYSMKCRMLEEISAGMSFLHSRNIIHRDLKCENVLLDKSYICKIMDFGLSRSKQDSGRMTKKIGTSVYMSPQVCLGNQYSEKCDIFSFGIMIYEIFGVTTLPYGDGMMNGLEMKVALHEDFRPDISKLKNCPEWIINLMVRCWAASEEDRPSFQEIIKVIEENEKEEEEGERKNEVVVLSMLEDKIEVEDE